MAVRFNIKKFSLAEMTSNRSGKTSASGTMGSLMILVGCIAFLIGSIAHLIPSENPDNVLMQSIALCYAGAALLGYRKARESAPTKDPE